MAITWASQPKPSPLCMILAGREQDELGVLSHTRARSAIKEGLFAQGDCTRHY